MYSTPWGWWRSLSDDAPVATPSTEDIEGPSADAGVPREPRARVAPQLTPPRADCCSAPPAYLVFLRPTIARPVRSELFLCGHHFRAHAAALGHAGAVGFDLAGCAVAC